MCTAAGSSRILDQMPYSDSLSHRPALPALREPATTPRLCRRSRSAHICRRFVAGAVMSGRGMTSRGCHVRRYRSVDGLPNGGGGRAHKVVSIVGRQDVPVCAVCDPLADWRDAVGALPAADCGHGSQGSRSASETRRSRAVSARSQDDIRVARRSAQSPMGGRPHRVVGRRKHPASAGTGARRAVH